MDVNGNVVDNNFEKATAFNIFFTNQSNIDDSSATLPNTSNNNASNHLYTEIILSDDEVKNVLLSLDTSKATGPDLINPRLLKEAASIFSFPLRKLFNKSLQNSHFPTEWKQTNVTPVHKKGKRNYINNYGPISLLCITGKVMERCVHNHIYSYFVETKFLCNNQSGFISGDSTVNQLLDISNDIGRALDSGREVRAVFCDISKAFDRVWHKGLLYKLQQAGIGGKLYLWFENYLQSRKQRVVINSSASGWRDVKAGVPQGSILGPLLFLVYINDIVFDIRSTIKLFADDTTLHIIVDNPVIASKTLNSDLDKIHKWSNQWLVTFNPQKTESITISTKRNRTLHPDLYLNGQKISEVSHHKHLGLHFSDNGQWSYHVNIVVAKASSRLHIPRRLKFLLDRKSLEKLYISFVRPVIEYADVVWDNISNDLADKLEKINIEAARIVSGATKLVSLNDLYREVGWDTLHNRRQKHKLIKFHTMVHRSAPDYLSSLIPLRISETHHYPTRRSHCITQRKSNTNHYSQSFLPSTTKLWNDLPICVQENPSVSNLKRVLNSNCCKTPRHFLFGKRTEQILHTRLRLNCSTLNSHLSKKHIIDNPNCACGQIETTIHFLLECPLYTDARKKFIDPLRPVTLNILLFGDPDRNYSYNTNIFKHVHHFISATKRFVT